MDVDFFESLSRHSIQSSPVAKEEHGVECSQVSFDTVDKCQIHDFDDLVPLLDRDNYVNASFYDWWEQVEPMTEEVPLICDNKEQAMDILNNERELILEQLRKQKKKIQLLQQASATEEINRWMKEARLEQELYKKRVELADCKIVLQDVLKEFDKYKAQIEPQLEEPEWVIDLLEEKVEGN